MRHLLMCFFKYMNMESMDLELPSHLNLLLDGDLKWQVKVFYEW